MTLREYYTFIKLIENVYLEHYNMHRRGAYDFPEPNEWVSQRMKEFYQNNIEELGFVWDKNNKDWYLSLEDGFVRKIIGS